MSLVVLASDRLATGIREMAPRDLGLLGSPPGPSFLRDLGRRRGFGQQDREQTMLTSPETKRGAFCGLRPGPDRAITLCVVMPSRPSPSPSPMSVISPVCLHFTFTVTRLGARRASTKYLRTNAWEPGSSGSPSSQTSPVWPRQPGKATLVLRPSSLPGTPTYGRRVAGGGEGKS